MSQRQILVTAALPYANNHIHIGNMLEHIQTNIWVRFQRLRGHRCISLCADDTHGTAIMISAAEQGIPDEELIARMQKAGRSAEASKLQEQLNKLLEQVPQMKQLDDLADQLGQCSQCLQDGQLADAADALNQLQANLQQQMDEMEMLNDAMEQLRMARNQMNCGKCGGVGCQACQGPPNMGMGAGSGLGPRPEAEEETATYKSQVRQNPGEGAAVVTGEVDGPNRKGDVKQTIQQDFEAARHSNTDPLTGRRIPRKHQKHVEEYFNRFREGE